MKRAAVLIPTSAGALEGIVHVPEGAPAAAAVVVPGATSRAGTNRKWARLADALAAQGIVVLRYDAVDSDALDDAAGEMRAHEAIDWFRERTDGADLLLCGLCYGARATLLYAAARRPLGIALVTPLLKRGIGRRDKLSVHAAQLMTRITVRTGIRLPSRSKGFDPAIARALTTIGSSPSPLIVVGERDHQWRPWWNTSKRPEALASATIEVVPGLQLHSPRTLETQAAAIERVTAWAVRTLRERVES